MKVLFSFLSILGFAALLSWSVPEGRAVKESVYCTYSALWNGYIYEVTADDCATAKEVLLEILCSEGWNDPNYCK